MRFAKLHGYGNDYIVIDERELTGAVTNRGEFVKAICARHRGAGADGAAIIGASRNADFSLSIINPDGGEAAMSGNGSRCAAAYLAHEKVFVKDELTFETPAGIKRFARHINTGGEARGLYEFTAEIGKPIFESSEIPMLVDEPLDVVRDYELMLDLLDDELLKHEHRAPETKNQSHALSNNQSGVTNRTRAIRITALQMCNPNVCVFVNDFDGFEFDNRILSWQQIGNLVETHNQFPARTNVEFVRVKDNHNIEARVWERGVGVTQSSGTGASAAAVAAMINGKCSRRASVEMPGGTVKVEWRARDDEVLLTGTAQFIYRGQWGV